MFPSKTFVRATPKADVKVDHWRLPLKVRPVYSDRCSLANELSALSNVLLFPAQLLDQAIAVGLVH